MSSVRILTATHRHWLLLLFACAMLVRAAIPAGWMPIAGAQGFRIIPCSGTGPAPAATTTTMQHAMPGMRHQGSIEHHEQRPEHDGQGPEHPCAFAGVTPAIPVPTPPERLVLVRVPTAFVSTDGQIMVGHGLAAPPPPQTGPPPFA